MRRAWEISFDSNDDEVVRDLMTIVNTTAAYMVDNVKILEVQA